MTKPYTILHLSDVHIGSPGSTFESDEVLKALIVDLQRVAKTRGLSPDLIVFNGDLAYGQTTTGIADQLKIGKKWIADVTDAFGISQSTIPILMVPGNHDRNLDQITRGDIEWVRNEKRTEEEIYASMEKRDLQWAHFIAPQTEWASTVKSLKHPDIVFDDSLHMSTLVQTVEDQTIGIAGLNSAWSCYKGGNEEKGKLWLGKYQLQKAEKDIASCTFKVAITHHPLDWLTPDEANPLKEKIQTRFNLHLHGHEHSQWFEPLQGHLKVAAGTCFETAKKPKGYSWIEINFGEQSATLHLREYQNKGAGGWIPLNIPGNTDDDGIATIPGVFAKNQLTFELSRSKTRAILPPVQRSSGSRKNRAFKDLGELKDFISVLEDSFGFRWEPWANRNSHSKVIVYWPVRLRQPTPIHALQCFAAAGLQHFGAKVILCLDDLGTQEVKPEKFNRPASKWFGKVKGMPTKMERKLFSQLINSKMYETIWKQVQIWLGDTQYKLEKIFRISKLEIATLDGLLNNRPRRLLTPALVWAALEQLRKSNPSHKVITLGGTDEKELWEAWRDLSTGSNAHVGHIYAPALLETKDDRSQTLHMAHTNLKLVWHSKQDIKKALDHDLKKGGNAFSESRLLGWCFSGCVQLPAYIAGESDIRTIGKTTVHGVSDFEALAHDDIINSVSEWVSQWLL